MERVGVEGVGVCAEGEGEVCVSVCVWCVCVPRDLTLLFKPCSYHGAGRLIWPLESKSKESGLCRAAHTHALSQEGCGGSLSSEMQRA